MMFASNPQITSIQIRERRTIPIQWLVALLLLMAAQGTFAAVTASLDRDTVRVGESVRLVLEFDEMIGGATVDTSPLNRDFDVLGTSTSSEVTIINGRQQIHSRLLIELVPRTEGRLMIPSLVTAQGTTRELELMVAPAAVGTAGDSLFLEVEWEPKRAYVQAPVHVVVRLFYSKPILEGSLSDPQPDQALVRRFGDDTQYSAVRDGNRYQVIERRFVVFPQRSGEMSIPGIIFDGRVADDGQGTTLGRLFQPGRRLRTQSDAIVIEVRAPPAAMAGDHWLPARHVSLTETWPSDTPEFVVGQPITRTLKVEARGVTGEQIPPLEIEQVDGIRHYPDKPLTDTTSRDNALLGTFERRVAMVPTRAGTFVLPEVTLAWWDTAEDRRRVERIPSRTVVVEAAADGQSPPTMVDGAAVSGSQLAESRLAGSEVEDVSTSAVTGAVAERVVGESTYWPWLTLMLALMWIATCSLWWRDRRARGAGKESHTTSPSTASLSAVKRACMDNDPVRARAALLAWARGNWSQQSPLGLSDIATRLEDESLREQFSTLDAACYASGSADFDGSAFYEHIYKSLQGAGKPARCHADISALPPLYPDLPAHGPRRDAA
jgi:hypothetical protein